MRRAASAVAALFCAISLVAAGTASASAATSLKQLVEVADIEALSVSPGGNLAAFRVQRASIQANSYRLDWYVADLDTGRTVRVPV